MSEAFAGAYDLIDDTAASADDRPRPQDYSRWVKEKLGSLQPGDKGILRLRRPRPTAAFSPQDTTHTDYLAVKDLALHHGFEPIERGTGGRLTMFDEGSLAVTLLWPQHEPHARTLLRYEVFSGAITRALVNLGINAGVGELPHEYCPGKYSIHAEGRVKLVGIAQRMTRRCVQMGAIIAVERSDKACAAIAAAYDAMGLPFDPQTYGAITDLAPNLTYEQVRSAVSASIAQTLEG